MSSERSEHLEIAGRKLAPRITLHVLASLLAHSPCQVRMLQQAPHCRLETPDVALADDETVLLVANNFRHTPNVCADHRGAGRKRFKKDQRESFISAARSCKQPRCLVQRPQVVLTHRAQKLDPLAQLCFFDESLDCRSIRSVTNDEQVKLGIIRSHGLEGADQFVDRLILIVNSAGTKDKGPCALERSGRLRRVPVHTAGDHDCALRRGNNLSYISLDRLGDRHNRRRADQRFDIMRAHFSQRAVYAVHSWYSQTLAYRGEAKATRIGKVITHYVRPPRPQERDEIASCGAAPSIPQPLRVTPGDFLAPAQRILDDFVPSRNPWGHKRTLARMLQVAVMRQHCHGVAELAEFGGQVRNRFPHSPRRHMERPDCEENSHRQTGNLPSHTGSSWRRLKPRRGCRRHPA